MPQFQFFGISGAGGKRLPLFGTNVDATSC